MGTNVQYDFKNLRAMHDHIIVADMQFSQRFTNSGIFLPSDNMKSSGIRPRWARVVAVGPEQKDVQVGQYIMLEHGRWTRGINVNWDGEELEIHRADNNAILMVSDEPQIDETLSDAQDGGRMQSDAKIHGSMHNSDTGYRDI